MVKKKCECKRIVYTKKDAERDIVALPEYPMKKVLLEGVDFLRGRAF